MAVVVQGEFGSVKARKLKKYVKKHHLTDSDEVDAVAVVVSDKQSTKDRQKDKDLLCLKRLKRTLPPVLVIVTHASEKADLQSSKEVLVSQCCHDPKPS